MRFNFHVGARAPTVKQWVAYSLGTAAAVALVVHFGNALLASRHGEFVRDAVCSVSKALPDGDLARLLASLCRASADRRITPDEGRQAVDRAAKAAGVAPGMFDRDGENTDLRAEDEVSYAIERWKRANPSPKIDPDLRRELPHLSETQLCVLSQAERYTDGAASGLRYRGMGVCEDGAAEVKLSFKHLRPEGK